MESNQAFSKGTPSVFVVCSPFQALVAIEAISTFNISKYKVFVHYYETEKGRIDQLVKLLENFNITYTLLDFTKISRRKLLKIIMPHRCEYKRAFIGHYRLDYLYYTAFENISDKSSIIYLDDGTNCLELLEGKYEFALTKNHIILLIAGMLRSLKFRSVYNLFTLYDDYPIKIHNAKVFSNNFSSLSSLLSKDIRKEPGGVYFIGTAHSDYYLYNGIPQADYWKSLHNILKQLRCKYKDEKLFYFPHGRDRQESVKNMCKELDISYIRPDTIVEIYMLNHFSSPTAIFGFTSSALFNLKKLYPNARVGNYFPLLHHSEAYDRISNYYMKHAIEKIDY